MNSQRKLSLPFSLAIGWPCLEHHEMQRFCLLRILYRMLTAGSLVQWPRRCIPVCVPKPKSPDVLSVFLFSNSHQLSPGGHALKLNSSSTPGSKQWEMGSHQSGRPTSGDSQVKDSSVTMSRVPIM